ncbi:polyprenyl synthetase family protein [Streptomyces laurentii]|uniref:polyprenyl synthetase family protein n=1 Tax=Streptomyces laurentii TaxID=39478 RepID=UPI003676D235
MPAPGTDAATTPLDLAAVREQVDACLDEFLTAKTRGASHRELSSELPEAVHHFVQAGGKRLRPLLCVIGWQAAGGRGTPPPVIRVAAALEMFHAFALIHDDIMDRSATRRGHPTAHRALAARHPDVRDPAWFGASAAILAGDLALAWSDELLNTSGALAEPLAEVRRVVDTMREDVIHGQYLDLLTQLRPAADLDAPLKVILYKTAKYTVECPLHTGMALAGADRACLQRATRFALPLGEAFQLRDDLLGVFGDPAATGKPVLDDLREGKHTVLLAHAHQKATPHQRAVLDHLVGDPGLTDAGAATVRDILHATGAPEETERLITTRRRESLDALNRAHFPPAATAALAHIADLATARTS